MVWQQTPNIYQDPFGNVSAPGFTPAFFDWFNDNFGYYLGTSSGGWMNQPSWFQPGDSLALLPNGGRNGYTTYDGNNYMRNVPYGANDPYDFNGINQGNGIYASPYVNNNAWNGFPGGAPQYSQYNGAYANPMANRFYGQPFNNMGRLWAA